MAADPRDKSHDVHKRWLGCLQPVGLVVSAPALADAGCEADSNVAEQHLKYVSGLLERPVFGKPDAAPEMLVSSINSFLIDVCGWRETDLVAANDPRAEGVVASVQSYGETLRPTFAVPVDSKANPLQWLMLIQELPSGTDPDAVPEETPHGWRAAPQAKFERLLRETDIPIGLLTTGTRIRLVYAPRGESAGHLTFPVAEIASTAGRSVFAAMYMLLREFRVFNAADKQRLADILAASRKYQSSVSTELAKQVLAALYELVRGFQTADNRRHGALLGDILRTDPNEIYAGQLTVLLRLVFLLYAEDRGLMADAEVYLNHYSVAGLFEKLRADEGRHPDVMDQRYGAWARLLALFRMVHDGAKTAAFTLPPRRGYLFDPDRYPFLEGRPEGSRRQAGERIDPPLVSDGVVLRVLRNLLILDGERLSYRALDVEQIGSVYEAMMGFRIETATGRSIAVRPKKPHGAPVTVNLEALLQASPNDRAKKFKEWTELDVTAKETAALKEANTAEDVVAAVERKVEKALTPNPVPKGSMTLQPSDERRRSGSHYTPRSLTGPIVEKALAPVLAQFGDSPAPEQILSLKICDPAMGSGAFLVETCRQLGEKLVEAWAAHRKTPRIPPDEDELLHAQRLVAQRCLYGVDKNPMAVDLAKLSLWLATLAKDHPFTFLDHALKEGDSLVGLTREQIEGFCRPGQKPKFSWRNQLRPRLEQVLRIRKQILEAGDEMPYGNKEAQLKNCQDALDNAKQVGDMVVACFFAETKDKARVKLLNDTVSEYSDALKRDDFLVMRRLLDAAQKQLAEPPELRPFHWEIEFPEVFDDNKTGFDCIVGNPPFAGKNTIADGSRAGFLDWLKTLHEEAHGNADLVAHFFRRAFILIRAGGAFGLIATNTISQGDTRSTGLRWICTNGGTIYLARRRFKWPGVAAVVVSVVHVCKGELKPPFELDGKQVERITAYLFHAGGNEDPKPLTENQDKSFIGSYVLGMGFTFDDADRKGVANSISVMNELIAGDARNAERIFPYIGGEEILDSPRHEHHRYVINFAEMAESEARTWPDLFQIVEAKVKPERMKLGNDSSAKPLKERWWLWGRYRPGLFAAIRDKSKSLVLSRVGQQMSFAFVTSGVVPSEGVVVVPTELFAAFAALQSRPHEIWARFFGSSLEDRLRYTPSDCFETFPFPPDFETNATLEAAGKEYYEFRAALMVKNNEGLTKTYNRFHDPHERSPEIARLRELHAALDRAVLTAYGGDLAKLTVPPCQFLLDYEDDEEDEDAAPGKRQKKKPWRYRWPDAFRDEVLALLLELNKQRAAAEAPRPKKGAAKKKKPAAKTDEPEDLFEANG